MAGVMAHIAVFHRGHRAVHDLHPQRLARLLVTAQQLGAFLGIPGGHALGNGGGIGQAQVEKSLGRVLENSADMVRDRIPLRLPLLSHDVADIDLQAVAVPDSVHDAVHQEIGDDAGVEAARPQHHHVRLPDGADRVRQRLGMLRHQPHLADAAVLLFFAVKNLRLAYHRGAVFKFRLQLDVRRGHRQHPSREGKYLAHAAHRHIKGRGDAVHGGQKEVPEALPGQGAFRKAVVQQLAHERLRVGQRLHTVADIPRRRHAQVLAQHAGPAAVIGHCHHGGEVFRIVLQSPQHGGKAVSAANDRHPGTVFFRHPI